MTCPPDCLACAVLRHKNLATPASHALARRVHELEAEVAALRLGTPITVEAWKRAKKI